MTDTTKKFDLEGLENKIRYAYEQYVDNDCEDTKLELVIAIKDLAFAILTVGKIWKRYDIDYEEMSYEYSVYMFERIVNGYKPIGTRDGCFPWQQYVRINLRHVVINTSTFQSKMVLIDNMAEFLDENTKLEELKDKGDQYFDKKVYASKLFKGLKMFFSLEEINRLYPISRDFIELYQKDNSKNNIPEDIKRFIGVMIGLSKRLIVEYELGNIFNLDISSYKKALETTLRSTIFLSLISDSDQFRKELFLSLDTNSLFRLVYSLGGETIKIPTPSEINNLIGAVVATSKNIVEGMPIEESVRKVKTEYELAFSRTKNLNVINLVNKTLGSLDLFKPDRNSRSILDYLILSTRTVKILHNKLSKNVGDMRTREVIDAYSEVTRSFSRFTESVLKIDRRILFECSKGETVRTLADVAKDINKNEFMIQRFSGEKILSPEYADDDWIECNKDKLKTIAILDIETTGLEHSAEIVEIAIKKFYYNPEDGAIVKILDSFQSFNEPSIGMDKSAEKLSGISFDMVKGHKIDLKEMDKFLEPCDMIVAHNAQFDRRYVDRISKVSPEKIWGCSCHDIDWRKAGLPSKAQPVIAAWHGVMYNSHRAEDDINAMLYILSMTDSFKELYDNATTNDYRVEAVQAPKELKDKLKSRRYRWDWKNIVWWITVKGIKVIEEVDWLKSEIYNGQDMANVIEIPLEDKWKEL